MIIFYSGHGGSTRSGGPIEVELVFKDKTNLMMTYMDFYQRTELNQRFREYKRRRKKREQTK